MKRSQQFFFGLILVVLSAGCANLEEVNKYSVSSVKTVSAYNDIDYSFTSVCLDFCHKDEPLEKSIVDTLICDCETSKILDENVMLMLGILQGYFSAMSTLSDKDGGTYKFDPLKKAITEGDFGNKIKINKEHAGSYLKITEILTNATTNAWRKKQIKKYLNKADGAVDTLIRVLDTTIREGLIAKIDNQKKTLKARYNWIEDMSNIPDFQKREGKRTYRAIITELDQKKKQLQLFDKGLLSIAKSHRALKENASKLTKKEVEKIVEEHMAYFKEIQIELKKLKP